MRNAKMISGVLICSGCCNLLWQTAAQAQQRLAVQPLIGKKQGSATGSQGLLPVRKYVDWHQSLADERRILRFLTSREEVVWAGMTIEQLANSIREHVPVQLRRDELDLLGIDPRLKIDFPNRQGMVSAQLIQALEPLELTIQLKQGALFITSQEEADSNPVLCSYKIAESKKGRGYDWDNLIMQIHYHIAPDSWLQNGGTNAMTVLERKDCWMLNVSAPFAVQLQVEAFLNELLPLKSYLPAELERQKWNAAPSDASELHWQLGLQASRSASKPRSVDGRLPSPWKDLPRGQLKLGSKKE